MVTCLGLDREATWQAVLRGSCGVGPLTAVESPLDPDKGGGQVNDPHDDQESSDPREVRLLRRALHEALGHAGIDHRLPCDPNRCSMILGTTLHGMRNGGAFLRTGDFQALRRFLAGAVLASATNDLPMAGLKTTNCSACSSGLASIAMAHTLLQTNEADVVIAGGYDPISEYAYAGFNSMRLVASGNLRPFARSREGMKLAEGYGVVVLERSSDATARGAQVLARVAGYGESCDAHHLSKPHPEGAGAAAAMRQALACANIAADEIDMVAAHATGTPDNDASEHAALAQVFGRSLPETPVVAFKSHLGHSLGGAGTVELILTALAIRDGVIPACANTRGDEIEYDDLRVTFGRSTKQPLGHSLNLSLGFGGANACIVLAAPGTARTPRAGGVATGGVVNPDPNRDALITGVGVVAPGGVGNDAFVQLVSQDPSNRTAASSGSIPREQYQHLIQARRTRRMSEFAKLCLAATAEAYRDAGIDNHPAFGETCSAIVGTTHASTEYCETYYQQILDEGVNAANPLLFAEGVPNVASAHLSTTFAIKGFCQTIIGARTAGLEALLLAVARIRAGVWQRAIVCAGDESTELIRRAYRNLAPPCDASGEHAASSQGAGASRPLGAGAVTFVLESRASATAREARVYGVVERAIGLSSSRDRARSRVSAVQGVIEQLGPLDAVASSVNPPHLDRIEQLGLRAAYGTRREGRRPSLLRPVAFLPEMFSAGPFAALAALMLPGSPPDETPRDAQADAPHARKAGRHPSHGDRIGVIGSSFVGGVCGVTVTLS